MPSKLLIRVLIAAIMLTPALPAVSFAQAEGEVVVLEDNFDDPAAGVLQEGSDDPNLRFDYDDGAYEIDAFADDFAGDLTVPVPGEFSNGSIAIDASLTGREDSNGHYLFLACRVRDDTGYKFEIRPLAQVAAIWLLSPDGNTRIANVGLEGEPGAGPFRLEFTCDDGQLTGRIDGQDVISVTDATYDQGSFAFGAGVYQLSAGPVSADFENLIVSVPESEISVSPDATPAPVDAPTEEATPESAEDVSPEATPEAADAATNVATEEPTEEPTAAPTEEPTQQPTAEPMEAPASQAAIFDRAGLAAAANQLREQASANEPLYGPESGTTDIATGQELLDFVAQTSFVVPEGDWSAGYAFRQIDGLGGIILISSNGAWLLTHGTEQVRAAGLVENLNVDPGAENTIELIAAGETGYLTVNGEFAAQLDLSLWATAGSLAVIGAAAGDGTPLEVNDATVWTLGEAAEPATETDIAPTATASPVPEESEVVEESPVAEVTVASTADEAAAFDEIVASTDGQDPLSGPDSGTLTQAIGSLDIASAGVITSNFYSTVRFSNPANAAAPDHPWDIVIGFWHTGGDSQMRVVISSDGTWSLASGTARPILTGTVDNLNLGEARGNDIGLAVLDGTGYLSVNGEFVDAFVIPAAPSAGDIWLASGTFPENAQEGVETPYSDWTIWSLERG
ncbi:MAG: hypothetical protein E6R14_07295 [Thermomicrobiales bacterium]|nr:MAG: hypothetical protein E6R14_07295 [Thermomicrobiales bacterium]